MAVLHHEEMALLHRAPGQATDTLALQSVLTAGGFRAADFAELLALFDAFDGSTSSASDLPRQRDIGSEGRIPLIQ